MSTSTDKKSSAPVHYIPAGMHSVTPHLVCAGAANAIEFYKNAFGATEIGRMPGPNGKLIHAMIQIGDSKVMLVDEFPEMGSMAPNGRESTGVTIHLYVENTDAVVARAVAAGAVVIHEINDMFWGDRYGVIKDPFGHQWSVATHLRDVSPQEMQQAAQEM